MANSLSCDALPIIALFVTVVNTTVTIYCTAFTSVQDGLPNTGLIDNRQLICYNIVYWHCLNGGGKNVPQRDGNLDGYCGSR
jgi:hypothetical protein